MKNEDKKDYNPEVTMEDVNELGDRIINQNEDGQGDDTQLKDRTHPVDFTGGDLDVPGRDLPKTTPVTHLKDEENQLYSQGSGHNDHLEDMANHSRNN